MAMNGLILSDSMLKYVTRERLNLVERFRVTTFSWGGATTEDLKRKARRLDFTKVEFVIVHAGTNDVAKLTKPVSSIVDEMLVSTVRVELPTYPT